MLRVVSFFLRLYGQLDTDVVFCAQETSTRNENDGALRAASQAPGAQRVRVEVPAIAGLQTAGHDEFR